MASILLQITANLIVEVFYTSKMGIEQTPTDTHSVMVIPSILDAHQDFKSLLSGYTGESLVRRQLLTAHRGVRI